MSIVGPIRSSPRLGVRALVGAVALMAALLLPRAASAQEGGGVVGGTVITEAGSRPLAGAQVAVQD